jgi:glucose-6-phosphate isomerase
MIKIFTALEALRSPATAVPMRRRFADDPDRFNRFSITFGNFLLDYSKNLIDTETMRHLLALAEAAEVERHRSQMFSGEPINVTEDRPVLHVALRAAPDDVYRVGGQNVVPEVQAVLGRMGDFAEGVR